MHSRYYIDMVIILSYEFVLILYIYLFSMTLFHIVANKVIIINTVILDDCWYIDLNTNVDRPIRFLVVAAVNEFC